jgi:hypothetical protein
MEKLLVGYGKGTTHKPIQLSTLKAKEIFKF